MKVEERHLTGIAFDAVETVALHFKQGDVPDESASWPEVLPGMGLRVSSARRGDDSFSVSLGCKFEALEGWELAAEVCGHFRVPEGRPLPLELSEFSKKHALVILMPFLRQVLAQLTAASRLGVFLLPPINVAALIDEAAGSEMVDAGAPARAGMGEAGGG